MKTRTQQIEELNKEWTNPRWEGITRPYSAEEVVKLRGSVNPECTLAQLGAAKMWRLLHGEAKKGYINSLGALTGGQALQQAKAGIEAIYLSGWQVAADANLASSMYPDQSLYPANSVPAVVDRINNTFRRADQIQWSVGIEPNDPRYIDYFLPIVADAEAGFGGVLNAFELMKSMIEAGAAAVHFEDQLASVKKCGHMGGKVLVPTQEAIQKLVAADANLASSMYPDQSLYPANSVPAVVDRINNTFRRADQIQWSVGIEPNDPRYIDYFLPIVADAEAGFGGVLNAFELMKSMIEAGAAAVHFEDQLASVKKCGHMGGKVLVPTQEAIQKLVAARLAADVMGVPTLVIARTDADAADLITSDCDPYDREFITGDRTSEGFFRTHAGIEQAISRGLAYAPYADLVWCETSKPDLEQARRFAEAIHARFPGKLLAYNCSPSFNWKKNLDDKTIASFQQQLSDMGYKYQFITLAGIHSMWFNMFDLAHAYAQGEGMRHYVEKVQQPEFAAAPEGYSFVSHQQEVGTGYFDKVTTIIQGGASSVTALTGSTEEDQF